MVNKRLADETMAIGKGEEGEVVEVVEVGHLSVAETEEVGDVATDENMEATPTPGFNPWFGQLIVHESK